MANEGMPLRPVSYEPPDYPSARLRPRGAAFVSPGRIIVAAASTYCRMRVTPADSQQLPIST